MDLTSVINGAFFFSSRRRHTRYWRDWSSDVCSSDLMQAAVGYPLTVHGTGGQTRAFIHIQDTVRCIHLAVENPPERGERVRIFNQMTEVHRVIDLAGIVSRLTGAEVALVDNPRKEATENELDVDNRQLVDLGLEPIRLRSEEHTS